MEKLFSLGAVTDRKQTEEKLKANLNELCRELLLLGFLGRAGGDRHFIPLIPDLAAGDLAEGGHNLSVLAGDKGVDPFEKLPGPLGRNVDKREPVFTIIKTIFYSDSCHGEPSLLETSP